MIIEVSTLLLFSVVAQTYEIQLFDEFVLKGNIALLHCPIPSYVGDYVQVTAWERMDGFLITPSIVSGELFFFLIKSLIRNSFSLNFFSVKTMGYF